MANAKYCRLLSRHPAQAEIQFLIYAAQATLRLYFGQRKVWALYVGVTSDLPKRIWQHQNNLVPGFTSRHSVHKLVWYEQHETMDSAIRREKAIKKWRRDWKLKLIEASNPDWRERYAEIVG